MRRPMSAAFACAAAMAGAAAGQDEEAHDTRPPAITEHMPQPAVLVFSKTKGWRHDEGIAGADLFFVRLAREAGYGVFTTENGAIFTPDVLARFDVVVFNNVTGDVLSARQEEAFADWMEGGGGFIGLHGSGDASSEDWSWYRRELIGPDYMNHPFDPQFQEARVEVLTDDHPVTEGLPREWLQTDEWYSFYDSATELGFTPILGLDEATYEARNTVWEPGPDLGMGPTPADHPIVWAACPGEGRSVYSALGHRDATYEVEPYVALLRNAFDWVRGETDPDSAGCQD